MGRQRAKDYEAKKKHLISSATELFSRQGFARTSMAELAQACGVSKALLYHYYPSKEALLNDLLLGLLSRLILCLKQAAKASEQPEIRLRAMVLTLLLTYQRAHQPQVLLLKDINALAGEQIATIRGLEGDITHLFQEALAQIAPATAQTPENKQSLQKIAQILIGSLSWAPTWLMPEKDGQIEDTATLLCDLLISALDQGVPKRAARTQAVPAFASTAPPPLKDPATRKDPPPAPPKDPLPARPLVRTSIPRPPRPMSWQDLAAEPQQAVPQQAAPQQDDKNPRLPQAAGTRSETRTGGPTPRARAADDSDLQAQRNRQSALAALLTKRWAATPSAAQSKGRTSQN